MLGRRAEAAARTMRHGEWKTSLCVRHSRRRSYCSALCHRNGRDGTKLRHRRKPTGSHDAVNVSVSTITGLPRRKRYCFSGPGRPESVLLCHDNHIHDIP